MSVLYGFKYVKILLDCIEKSNPKYNFEKIKMWKKTINMQKIPVDYKQKDIFASSIFIQNSIDLFCFTSPVFNFDLFLTSC